MRRWTAPRQSLGTAVFGGMIAATVLAVFFVPVFYVGMQRLSEWRTKKKQPAVAVTPKPVPKISLPPEPVHAAHP